MLKRIRKVRTEQVPLAQGIDKKNIAEGTTIKESTEHSGLSPPQEASVSNTVHLSPWFTVCPTKNHAQYRQCAPYIQSHDRSESSGLSPRGKYALIAAPAVCQNLPHRVLDSGVNMFKFSTASSYPQRRKLTRSQDAVPMQPKSPNVSNTIANTQPTVQTESPCSINAEFLLGKMMLRCPVRTIMFCFLF